MRCNILIVRFFPKQLLPLNYEVSSHCTMLVLRSENILTLLYTDWCYVFFVAFIADVTNSQGSTMPVQIIPLPPNSSRILPPTPTFLTQGSFIAVEGALAKAMKDDDSLSSKVSEQCSLWNQNVVCSCHIPKEMGEMFCHTAIRYHCNMLSSFNIFTLMSHFTGVIKILTCHHNCLEISVNYLISYCSYFVLIIKFL